MNCTFCHLPVPSRLRNEAAVGPVYCCYGCRFAAEVTHARGEAGQVNWLLARLGVAVFLSMSVMMFSMFGYRQQIAAAEGVLATDVSTHLGELMQYLSLLFATPVFLMLGVPIFAHAFEQNRRRAASTDALIVLGVAAAYIYSYVATITGRGDTYYETACGILVFVTLGRWLEARGRLRASDAITALHRLLPDEVTVERDGRVMEVSPRDVQAGDRMRILAGQRICADGCIESGTAAVDEQTVTGESTPIEKHPGDIVRAGTLNLDGVLHVHVTTDGRASTLARLAALLEAARQSRGRYQRIADHVAAVFLPLTIVAALAAGVLGLLHSGWDAAVLRPLAVLLIACPCALGIATPAAIWVALGAAAARHMIIRDAETLERLAKVSTVCFDKTGTLTTAHPRVGEFVIMTDENATEVLHRAARLASLSSHALARAVVAHVQSGDESKSRLDDARTIPGRGVVARWYGEDIAIGSSALMASQGMAFDEAGQDQLRRIEADARPMMLVGWQGRVRGIFVFDESLRSDAAATLHDLQRLGYTVRILTGDHERRGHRLSELLDTPVDAALSPEDKVRIVKAFKQQDRSVAVVGDGMNDAPALAAADVGMAMGCGADIARDCAAVCLASDELSAVPWLLSLGRRTVRVIRQNLFWAFAYNGVGVALAMTGRLSPLFAAAAMVGSSLLVVANSLRLGFEPSRGGGVAVAEPPLHLASATQGAGA